MCIYAERRLRAFPIPTAHHGHDRVGRHQLSRPCRRDHRFPSPHDRYLSTTGPHVVPTQDSPSTNLCPADFEAGSCAVPQTPQETCVGLDPITTNDFDAWFVFDDAQPLEVPPRDVDNITHVDPQLFGGQEFFDQAGFHPRQDHKSMLGPNLLPLISEQAATFSSCTNMNLGETKMVPADNVPYLGSFIENLAGFTVEDQLPPSGLQTSRQKPNVNTYSGQTHSETSPTTSSSPICCPVPRCGKTFTRRSSLTRHLKTIHGNGPQQQCPFCPSQFQRKDQLTRHFKSCKNHRRRMPS